MSNLESIIERIGEKLLLGEKPQSEDTPATSSEWIGKFVIVRCRDAGVHAGILEEYSGRGCTLSKSRRLWYWKSGDKEHTLSGVARAGLAAGCKIAGEVDIILTENCEIIQTTTKAKKSIQGYEVYNVE